MTDEEAVIEAMFASEPEIIETPVKSRTSSSTGAKRGRPRGSRSTAALKELEGDLTEFFGEVGLYMMGAAPTAGYITVEHSKRLGPAVVALVKDHPRLLKMAQRVSKVNSGAAVGKYAFTLLIALQVDFGRMAPDTILAERLGVTDAYNETHEEKVSAPTGGGFVNGYSTFNPIG